MNGWTLCFIYIDTWIYTNSGFQCLIRITRVSRHCTHEQQWMIMIEQSKMLRWALGWFLELGVLFDSLVQIQTHLYISTNFNTVRISGNVVIIIPTKLRCLQWTCWSLITHPSHSSIWFMASGLAFLRFSISSFFLSISANLSNMLAKVFFSLSFWALIFCWQIATLFLAA